jgi:hypothetical protein
MHFVPIKAAKGSTPGQAFCHHFACMINSLLPFRRHEGRTIGREDGNWISAFQDNDLLSLLYLREQFGKRMIGLTSSDSFQIRPVFKFVREAYPMHYTLVARFD